MVILLSPGSNSFYQFAPEAFPVQAVKWLKSNPQNGRMFNDLNWGGYLELNLHPQKTFTDSAADLTGEVTRDYEAIISTNKNWRELLDQYQITWTIIPADAPLANQLEQESGWIVLYEDPVAVIFQRK